MRSLPLHIRLDDLSDPRIAQFLEEHLQDMRATSPPESVHALDLSKLRDPSVHFWSAWMPSEGGALDGTLVGTGAIKRLDAQHAELKSMRTAAAFRGQAWRPVPSPSSPRPTSSTWRTALNLANRLAAIP